MEKLSSLLALFIILTITVQSQEMNRRTIDDRFNKEIMIGYCDRMGLEEGEFGQMFKLEYKDFNPDKKAVNKLQKVDEDISMVLVMGTWCPDCHELVPRFYKILDEAGISDESLKVICVDGRKSGRDISLEKFRIEKVPTFIFYRKDKEIGRIVENPVKSLEEDMLGIVL